MAGNLAAPRATQRLPALARSAPDPPEGAVGARIKKFARTSLRGVQHRPTAPKAGANGAGLRLRPSAAGALRRPAAPPARSHGRPHSRARSAAGRRNTSTTSAAPFCLLLAMLAARGGRAEAHARAAPSWPRDSHDHRAHALPAADERRASAACQQLLPACLPACMPACLPAGLPAFALHTSPGPRARWPRAAGGRAGRRPSGTRIALRATNPLLVSPSIISFNIIGRKARPYDAPRKTNHPLFRGQASTDGRPPRAALSEMRAHTFPALNPLLDSPPCADLPDYCYGGRPEESPALPPLATPLALRRTPDEALAERCAHTHTAPNPLFAPPPSARQPETLLLDLERYLARPPHPHGTTGLALSPAAPRSVDITGYKYHTSPRPNPFQQRQPNYGREEREAGLELCVTGCYYGDRSTSHAKAQRRTRPDIETRGDTRDSERELASELPRTEKTAAHLQEDEGPDRPSPPHQDYG